MADELRERQEKILKFLKEKKTWLIYISLAAIIYFGMFIRTRNLWLMKGKYPLALDPYVILRYARYIVENGHLMTHDPMRYFPIGFNPTGEFSVISYFIVYLYKFLHFFNPSLTLTQADILYPVICFGIGTIFFFLFVKKLFDYRVALLSSAFLAVIPGYLYRTMAGFSDKESLAMMLLFMAFYFYVSAWQSKKLANNITLGLLSGITTGIMGLVWGGVNFVFLAISGFALIEIFLKKFEKKDFYTYTCWLLPLLFILTVPLHRFKLIDLVVSFTSGIAIFAFFMGLVDFLLFKLDLFKIRGKIENKLMPLGLVSFLVSTVLIVIITSIMFGPSFLIDKIHGVIDNMVYPLSNRWALTVAESHQPYIKDWFDQLSQRYVYLFLIGSVVLFYEMLKPLKKQTWKVTLLFALFLYCYIFSRYASDAAVLNGITPFSRFIYLGSFIAFLLVMAISYIYSFYKNKEVYHEILKLDKKYTFVFIWLIIMLTAGRTAIRLVFVLTPMTVIMVAYLIIKLSDYTSHFKDKTYKIISYVVLILVTYILLSGFAKASIGQATYTGPSYNQQWQTAGDWVRQNIPENAVFAHWWDYGYWVQTGFGRTTITDGGNAMGSWNHFVGRHLLTTPDEDDALEFLLTHNVTNVLMISDEIGKYTAFSSIGADENYDRYSWIPTLTMDPKNIQETRNETIYLFRAGFVLDDDFIYENQLFPARQAGIGAFLLPIQQVSEQQIVLKQPTAILIYNNNQVNVPLECVFFNGQEINFEKPGLKGCLRIIPKIDDNKMNPMGAALYLSPDVRSSLFTQLYLFDKPSKYFKVVYDDSQGMPLALYNGRQIGPLKIWGVTYPDYIKPNLTYLSTGYPNVNVTKI